MLATPLACCAGPTPAYLAHLGSLRSAGLHSALRLCTAAAADVLSQQALEVQAMDLALEDVLYALDKALLQGSGSPLQAEDYLKQVGRTDTVCALPLCTLSCIALCVFSRRGAHSAVRCQSELGLKLCLCLCLTLVRAAYFSSDFGAGTQRVLAAVCASRHWWQDRGTAAAEGGPAPQLPFGRGTQPGGWRQAGPCGAASRRQLVQCWNGCTIRMTTAACEAL